MKVVLLTLASIAAILILLNAGYYRVWFADKPAQYWSDFLREKSNTLDHAAITSRRYGYIYTACMRAREMIARKNVTHPVILLEPNSLYRDSLHIYPDIYAPMPALFYYYTGLEGVWTNSPDVRKANFLLRFSKKDIELLPITSPEELQRLRDGYKKYPLIF